MCRSVSLPSSGKCLAGVLGSKVQKRFTTKAFLWYSASEELDGISGAFNSEESPDTMLTWNPPEINYEGLEDTEFLAEESKPLARGPLFGFSVAIMIAGGAFFMLKA